MDRRRIALRAYTEIGKPRRLTHAHWHPPETEHILVFDTETTIGPEQSLLVGFYRFCRIDWSRTVSHLVTLEEGLIAPTWLRSQRRSEHEILKLLWAHIRWTPAVSDERNVSNELRWRTPRSFVANVLIPAARGGATLVGFNLPFDLSRLCEGWGATRGIFYGGIGLDLLGYRDRRERKRSRCSVRIMRIGSKRHMIELSVSDPSTVAMRARGRCLDLHTLCFALSNKSYTLEGACNAFGADIGKLPQPRFGVISEDLLIYARQDVAATAALCCAVLSEYRSLALATDPAKVYSPASISKALFRCVGFNPPLVTTPDFDRRVLAIATESYNGGRVECLVRRHSVPVRVVDFRSTYPTLSALLGVQNFLAAEHLDVIDATEEVRQLLNDVEVESCMDPGFWGELVCFVQVNASGDLLPARAQLGADSEWNSLLCHLFREGHWVTLCDAIASKLLTKEAPEVVRAMRVRPVGVRALKALRLGPELEIDPGRKDIFVSLVEERERTRHDERISRFLKTVGNATYGIMVEFRRKKLPKDEAEVLDVHTSRSSFRLITNAPEEPGPWCFPPLGATITAAARLVLALLERKVSDAGGVVAYMDTDSAFIVASPEGGLVECPGGSHKTGDGMESIWALPFAQVQEIVDSFGSLDPYDATIVGGHLLKVEPINFRDDGTDRQLMFFGIASKRYALYEQR